MKIELWVISKTKEPYIKEGIQIYTNRLKHYCSFNLVAFPDPKFNSKTDVQKTKEKEAETVLKGLKKDDFLVLLDEKGKTMGSRKFASFLENFMTQGQKRVVFLVGGAFGFAQSIYDRANFKLSLSEMTFSHQMIRLFFLEQLYRAFTIIRNEKYHND